MKYFRPIAFILGIFALGQTIQAGSICAILFEHANFGGETYIIYNPDANTSFVGDWWNDKVSSVSVMPNCRITLFEHPNFGGNTINLYGYNSFAGDYWDEKASSFACHCN